MVSVNAFQFCFSSQINKHEFITKKFILVLLIGSFCMDPK